MFKKLSSTSLNTFINAHVSVLLLRLGAGAVMLTHGLPKLQKIMAGDFTFADPIGFGPVVSLLLAAFAEGICSIFLMLGLWSRLSALMLSFTMATAYFVYHSADPFGTKEPAMLFLIIFVVLFFTGGGKYSLDKKIS